MYTKQELVKLKSVCDSIRKVRDGDIISKSAGHYKVKVWENKDGSRFVHVDNSSGMQQISLKSRQEVKSLIFALEDAMDFIN